jgi:hypothetical protein
LTCEGGGLIYEAKFGDGRDTRENFKNPQIHLLLG